MDRQLGNRYRLGEIIGQGGMAQVYRAEDELLGRTVAVKVLREQYANDQAFVGRFLQEARSAASLSHPNIVNVYDVGDEDGRYYIVMEYVDGASLKDLIQQEAPFPVDRMVDVASQICAGLQAAHGRGLIHRDIKPQNVLVTREGQVKIADFGIARALGEASFSETGQVFGSIHYLSPEQAQGKLAVPASDIYSLGIVCYELLTARLPFEGETVVGIALRHIQEPPLPPRQINPAVPPSLESIVLKALAKEPAARFASAKEMSKAFQEYAKLGEQATGLMGAVKAPPARAASRQTSRVTPVVAERTRGASRPADSSGSNFLLLALAILAFMSVIGLCALGSAVFQAYSEKLAAVIPTISIPRSIPTAGATPTIAKVTVPKVEGLDVAQARAQIKESGLLFSEGPPEASDAIPAGRIIRQSLQPGISVMTGLEVKVVVSTGPNRVEVPFVIGLSYSLARSQLEAKGLKVDRDEEKKANTPPEIVFEQEPKAGTRVAPGARVTLSVSKQNKKVSVPDVVGKKEMEAKKIIEEAGLQNGQWSNYQGHGDLPDWLLESVPIGHVLSTTPKAGTEVDPDTVILMGVRKD